MKASGVQPKVDNLSSHGFMPDAEMKALVEKYQHPILKKYGEMAKEVGGHGGMDFIMDSRLVYCLQNGLPLDMDVYDLAEWCCLAELGALSMDNNCALFSSPTLLAVTGTTLKDSSTLSQVLKMKQKQKKQLKKLLPS